MAMATTRGEPAAGTARRYWQAQVEAQRRSGLSQAAFCRRQGVPKGTFGFWKWKLRQEAGGGPGRRAVVVPRRTVVPAFVPVQIAPVHAPRTGEPMPVPDWEIEITFGDGRSMRVRGHVDAAWLVQVLRGLEGPRC
jgi:hypothetical protein